MLEIIGGIVVLLILIAIGAMYNGLVVKRNRVQDAWAQIDVQLKRRYDLSKPSEWGLDGRDDRYSGCGQQGYWGGSKEGHT